MVQQPAPPLTIATNSDGIGNRIKCILSALRLDPGARVFWPKTASVQCDFADLFENDLAIGNIPKDARVVNTWKFLLLPGDRIPEKLMNARSVFYTESGDPGPFLDGSFHEIPTEIRDDYVKWIQTLRPSRPVREAVSEASSRFSPGTVSVHVRTWSDAWLRRLTFHLKNYESAMRESGGADFFVCSDDQARIGPLKEKFQSRVFTLDEASPRALELKQEQYALAEIILLGKAKKMLLTSGSTFGEVGWFFGGCGAHVTVVTPGFWSRILFRAVNRLISYRRKPTAKRRCVADDAFRDRHADGPF